MNIGRGRFGLATGGLVTLLLAACGGGGSGGSGNNGGGNPVAPPPLSYRVGGTVTGLAGSGLTLQVNAGGDLAVSSAGGFQFGTPFAAGANYTVTVRTQPRNPSQTCVVSGGAGAIGSSDVTSVAVTCTTDSFAVGGTVSGLAGAGLVLVLNGGTFLPVAADGGFTFPIEIDSGGAYEVGISQLPAAPAQRCEITNGQGSVGDADVADIAITCATRHARFALVANHDANTLTTYALDGTTGRMSLRDYAVSERDPVGVVVDASGRFVYVAAESASEIVAFEMDERGELARLDGDPVAAGDHPQTLALHPHGRLLVVPNLLSGDISVFSVDPATGALSEVAGSPFDVSADARLTDVEISADGRFVFAIDAAADAVWVFGIDAAGALSVVAGSPFASGGTNTFKAVLTFDDRFLVVANSLSDDIGVFAVNEDTGALTAVAGSPFPAGDVPRALALDPSGRFLYVANGGSDELYAYRIDPKSGALSVLNNGRVPTGDEPSAVAVDPTGQWLHVTNRGDSTVTTYLLDASTGRPVPRSTVAARRAPAAIALTNDAAPLDLVTRHAYVVNHGGHSVSVLAVDESTGALAPQGAPVPAGNGPSAMALHPQRDFAYVTSLFSEDIQAFSIGADGSLESNGVPVAGVDGPVALVFEPTGRFAYVANVNDGTVMQLDVDDTTGQLAPRANPTSVAPGVQALAMDPAGQYLFAASQLSAAVYIFRIDVAGGSLQQVGLPVPTDGPVLSLALDASGTRLHTVSSQTNTLGTFAIDRSTGALSPLGTPAPVVASPRDVAARPIGTEVFTISFQTSQLSRYTRGNTSLEHSVDVTVPDGPADLVIDPEGRFAWVVSALTGTVSAYRIDAGGIEYVEPATVGAEPVTMVLRETF